MKSTYPQEEWTIKYTFMIEIRMLTDKDRFELENTFLNHTEAICKALFTNQNKYLYLTEIAN